MATKLYKGAPFGVQTARFVTSGVHPRNKMPASYTEVPYDKKATSDLPPSREELARRLGPGRYEAGERGAFSKTEVNRRREGPGWERSVETQRQSKMPHLLNRENHEAKELLVRKLGPGSYELRDWLQDMDKRPSSTRGVLDTREARFRQNKAMDVPGPGTYGKGGVPSRVSEEKAEQSFSNVGLLDAKSSMPRSLPAVGSELGPGTYEKRSFTDEMSQRLVSKRGPYELFSGDRNKPIKVGYMAAPMLANLGPGQYNIKDSITELGDEHHKKKGKFSKLAQYPETPGERMGNVCLPQSRRDKDSPGPGSYEPRPVSGPAASNQPGFLSGARRDDRMSQKFFTRNFNPVGAGRYEVQKFSEAQHRNGHSSAFDSKTDRITHRQEKAHKERVRGKDLQKKDRIHMVAPEHPSVAAARFEAYQAQSRGVTRRAHSAA